MTLVFCRPLIEVIVDDSIVKDSLEMGYVSKAVVFISILFIGILIGVFVANEYHIQSVNHLFEKLKDFAFEYFDGNRTQSFSSFD